MRNKLRNIGKSHLYNGPGQVNQKIESTAVVKPIIKPKPELIETIKKPTFAAGSNFAEWGVEKRASLSDCFILQ